MDNSKILSLQLSGRSPSLGFIDIQAHVAKASQLNKDIYQSKLGTVGAKTVLETTSSHVNIHRATQGSWKHNAKKDSFVNRTMKDKLSLFNAPIKNSHRPLNHADGISAPCDCDGNSTGRFWGWGPCLCEMLLDSHGESHGIFCTETYYVFWIEWSTRDCTPIEFF